MLPRPNGLARAAVRFRPSAFAGTLLALLMTAAIVSACGILLETGARASVPPTRYAGAPVVVAADQRIHVRAGGDEVSYEVSTRVPERARVDAALLERLAPLGRAVPDVTFPVRDGANGTVEAAGWGSTAFTGTRLGHGRAPAAAGEVVLGGPGADRDRLTLDTPVGEREFRVVGRADAPGAWFSDTEARALSGHPDALDAIALLPGGATGHTTGTTAPAGGEAAWTARTAAAAAQAVDGRAQVLTGADRATDPQLSGAQEALIGLGGSFGGIATLVAVFTAAGTVALSVGQRSREYALLRAVGATPRQIRRTVATEALLVAPAAGALGCLPGIALASWWFGELKARGAVPAAVELTVSWIPLVSAVGIAVVAALLAGWTASRRPARIRPGQALAEAAVERIRPGRVRTPLGLAALAGGTACAGLAAGSSGEGAANAALGVVMLFMLAVALLGPMIARACAAVLGLPLRAAGAAGELAAANSRTNARRLASALTPLVLAMAFASTLVFLHTSQDRAAVSQQREGLLADHVISDPGSGAGTVPGGVAVTRTAVVTPLGSGDDRRIEAVSAQGVSGDLATVQDLGVREGGLDRLAPGRVAVDRTVAESAGAGVGDRIDLYLPDGTRTAPEIVAVYTRGLGLAQVTLPAADLVGHTTSGRPTELLVKGPAPEGLGPVADREGWAVAQSVERDLNAWANTTMAAVLGGFAVLAAANTLVMTVLDRRRELRMLRLVGSTRAQVLRMLRWEALLISGSGVVLGSVIALATLVPLTRALTGEPPHVPPLVYGSFVAGALLVGLAATLLPARRALRPATS